MKRDVIIGAVAAFALAAPAGTLAASSGSQPSIDRVKVEKRDASGRSRDPYAGERKSWDVRSKDTSRDAYSGDRSGRDVTSKADPGSPNRSESGSGHDTSSADT